MVRRDFPGAGFIELMLATDCRCSSLSLSVKEYLAIDCALKLDEDDCFSTLQVIRSSDSEADVGHSLQ